MMTNSLLHQIHAYDFALIEINLYLDTHPCDQEALEKLACLRRERNERVAQYEQQYGPLIVTAADATGDGCWAWVNNPWPWD